MNKKTYGNFYKSTINYSNEYFEINKKIIIDVYLISGFALKIIKQALGDGIFSTE